MFRATHSPPSGAQNCISASSFTYVFVCRRLRWLSHLNIITQSTPASLKRSLTLRFPHQNPVYASLLSDTRYMTRPSDYSRFYHHNNIWWGIQIITLLFKYFSPLSCYLLPLRPKYSPQRSIKKTPSPYVPPSMWSFKFHTHTKKQAKI
jgi:hypothetical protein